MKKTYTLVFVLIFQGILIKAQVYKKYLHDQTPTYRETINYYQKASREYPDAKLFAYGKTDAGKPLHLFVISKDRDFDPASIRKKGKRILLINNAIHPGEPCGVDASVKLVQELLKNKIREAKYLEQVVICIIPIYNTGGALNRNCCSRANQNGPGKYGFRGNARNLDLNRDFIKCDSRNAKIFNRLFRLWDPDVFLDTHTSNGADYRHTMTLIATQHNKLHPLPGNYLDQTMVPALYRDMANNDFPMVPYVHLMDRTPENGIRGFMETPRYSTGYAALFHSLGFVSETHMLKPFKKRVLATYQLILTLLKFTAENSDTIGRLRNLAKNRIRQQKTYPLSWKLDTTKFDRINFKGYRARYKKSAVTGAQRLYYDHEQPYEKKIRYYHYYRPGTTVNKPVMYIIPQAWRKVIDRLQWNEIKMRQLAKDTSLKVMAYYIKNYETIDRPYEGHYLHTQVETEKSPVRVKLHKGDYVIRVNQPGNRYIVETLEPGATGAFFAWNFFDAILQQKEWFSSYVFEEKADSLLNNQPGLKESFQQKKTADSAFAQNPRAQLYYIYRHSQYYENTHNRYPVYRVERDIKLPLKNRNADD